MARQFFSASAISLQLATAAILLVGLSIAPYSSSFAQIIIDEQSGQRVNGTSADTVNGTQAGPEMTEMEMPPLDPVFNQDTIVLQGTIASPGEMAGPFQIVDILPPRPDGAIYHGWITFTASAPVLVAPLQNYAAGNDTLRTEYGDLFVFPGAPNGTMFAPAPFEPEYNDIESDIPLPEDMFSASTPFAGNGLSVGTLDGEPFLMSYTVYAEVEKPVIMNNFQGAISNETAIELPNNVTIPVNAAFLTDDAYQPNPITVEAGDTITWINSDPDPHTVTSGSVEDEENEIGQDFDSGYMGPQRTFAHTFEESGVYDYFCVLHPNMVGQVFVEEGN